MKLQKFTPETLTPQLLQDIYDEVVAAEYASRAGAQMADFDLLCKADEAGGIAHVVRKLIDMVRAAPQPQTDETREAIRIAHANWSRETFGNVGPVGPLKHLSKEALEAAAEPGDLSEWADMQFLLWDAQRNAGITDEQITAAMITKLEVNKARQWPEPKDGEPRLHIKGTENDTHR